MMFGYMDAIDLWNNGQLGCTREMAEQLSDVISANPPLLYDFF